MATPSSESPRVTGGTPSLLDRFLNIFADVKAGEGWMAVLMTVTIFIILSAYYVLKPVREGLVLTGGMLGLDGAELKIYAGGAMALLLVGVVPAYGALASRVGRLRLINICYTIVVACLGVFFLLGQAHVPLGLVFFLWVGIVNVFLIAQFWSYANDLYSDAQGKRLFAIIAIGGSAGAIAGPALADLMTVYPLMLFAGGLLLAALALFNVMDKLTHARADGTKGQGNADAPLDKKGGFELVLKERYLLLIAIMMLLANIVNTTGEFILSSAFADHAKAMIPDGPQAHDLRGEAIKEMYAHFFFWVNLIGLLIQSFLASRIIKYAGVRVAIFVLPVIALGGYGAIGLVGGLTLLRIAKTAENGTDYSLQNTVRQTLFLPTSREAKYKAKAAIDTFFVRFGDALAALVVLAGISLLHLSPPQFALVNVAVVGIWLVVTFGVAREHKKLTADEEANEAKDLPKAKTEA